MMIYKQIKTNPWRKGDTTISIIIANYMLSLMVYHHKYSPMVLGEKLSIVSSHQSILLIDIRPMLIFLLNFKLYFWFGYRHEFRKYLEHIIIHEVVLVDDAFHGLVHLSKLSFLCKERMLMETFCVVNCLKIWWLLLPGLL